MALFLLDAMYFAVAITWRGLLKLLAAYSMLQKMRGLMPVSLNPVARLLNPLDADRPRFRDGTHSIFDVFYYDVDGT